MTETKGPCPSHSGDTSGTDSYVWNSEKNQGHCFSCALSTWLHQDTGELWGKRDGRKFVIQGEPPVLDAEELFEEDTFVSPPANRNEGEFKALRGITKETMEYFDVTYHKSVKWKAQNPKTKEWESGVSDEVRFPNSSGGYEARRLDLPKDHFAHFFQYKAQTDQLWPMWKFPAGCSKKVVLTEGKFDAQAAWQMLKSGSYINPVVSFQSAVPSGKMWEKCKAWLDSFEQIILSVDNDGPGKKLSEKVSLMFPGKVFVLSHGHYKDANDFLMAGEAQTYKAAWWNVKRFRLDDMLVDPDDYLKLYDESPDFEYFPTGIPELDQKILGINKGYFTVIQAPTGVGKSEFMRYLEYQCLTTSKFKFAYMHLEESKLRSVLGLVSYDLGDNLTLKKFIDEKGREEDVRQSISDLTSSERMIQFSYKPEDGYESLLKTIQYLVAAFDVDYVFFEPIQDLVNGEDKEGKLSDLSSRLGTMASDLGVGIVTIAHQNQNGDTLYATMIGKKAAFEILLERDQKADTHEERNRTYVKVGRKNRVGLGNGAAGAVDFDFDSFTLKPVQPTKEPKVADTQEF